VSATGLVTYTPTHGFVGVDSLTVVVTDNGTPPLSGSITFEANVCDTQLPPPDALPNIATPANTPASTTIQLASTRPQQVSALLHTSPSHGAAELAIAATQVVVTYTPEAGFTGSDPFEVAVTAVFTDGGCPPVQMGILPVSVTVTPSDLGDVDGLIAAIAAANASGTPSTVSVEPGRYVLTAVHNITGGPNGLPTITGNVQLLGTDPLTTTITRGTPTPLRLLYVAPGGTLFLSGVTLDNGDATTPEVPNTLRVGGALFNEGTTVLDNVVIMNSQALSGGGVANRGTLSATSSMIENNQAASHGGGISSETSEAGIILSDSTISANSAGGDGGGIYLLTSPAVITNSTVQGNTAQNGAGIANTLGSSAIVATVMGSTISGNLASSNGGGMINTVGSIATLTNATVSGNFSHLSGGGLYNADGEVVFFNSTVTDNTADNDSDGSGNGGGIASTVDTGLTTILLTLIAGNRTGAGQGPDCTGALTSQGYNVLGNLSNCIVTGDTTGNLTDLDPLLGPLQDNGGATATHDLLSGSPAIDAGNNAFCLTEDQRALPRPVDGNGDGTAVCDIGAYEVQP
jgi:hypothetical protein